MSEIVHVKGLTELKRNLEQLPAKLGAKVLRKSVGAGAQVIKAATIRNVEPHNRSGTLARAAIVKFVREESNDTQVYYVVTFRRGKRYQSKVTKKGRLTLDRDAYYAAFYEFGHKIVARRGKGGRTVTQRRLASGGRVEGRHPLGQAFDQNVGHAIDVIKQTMSDELAKALP